MDQALLHSKCHASVCFRTPYPCLQAKREADEDGAEELEEALAGVEPGEEPCFKLPRALQVTRAPACRVGLRV